MSVKLLKGAIMCVLSLNMAFASMIPQAGMGKCETIESDVLKTSDYGVLLINNDHNYEIVGLRGRDRHDNHIEEEIGIVMKEDIDELNPLLRRVPGVVFGGVGVIGAVAVTVGTGGMVTGTAAGGTAGLSTMMGGMGVAFLGGVVTLLATATNPVYHYERAAIEKCLQGIDIESSDIVIPLNNEDDYKDTVKSLKDLVNDL